MFAIAADLNDCEDPLICMIMMMNHFYIRDKSVTKRFFNIKESLCRNSFPFPTYGAFLINTGGFGFSITARRRSNLDNGYLTLKTYITGRM